MSQGYESHAPSACCGEQRASGGSRRGSVTFGIVLVVLGSAFLWAQFVPVVEWWSLWPLAVVVLGFVQAFTPGDGGVWGVDRLAEGFGTALLGALLLGNTTGVIPWLMWLTFISLWPILIISAGVALVGKASGMGWIRALSPLMIWATMLYSAAVATGLVTRIVPEFTLIVR